MILSWRRRKALRLAGTNNKISDSDSDSDSDTVMITVPSHFRCPISLELMKDPVTLSTGITYDRESIEKWIESGHTTCPVTKQVFNTCDHIPNHAIRKIIQDWCVENHAQGVERIPTPRIPITQFEVAEIRSKIMSSTGHRDAKKCEELVGKIELWAKESERNKQCVIDNGTGYTLSYMFESFSSFSVEKHACLLKMILSTLTWMFPLGLEGQSKLASSSSLRCMGWFLKGEDISSRKNAVFALEKLLPLNQHHVNAFAEIEGVEEALFNIIKNPISPKATKASLMAIYHLITHSSTNETMARRFVEMGLVELVLEIIVDGERSTCERGLGVLEGMCENDHKAIEVALNHALTMPVLVKKILRVSDAATEFSVAVLWRLCRDENGKSVVVEAVQLGCFEKLLVVLQVGCGERTKEKATLLLKLLNR